MRRARRFRHRPLRSLSEQPSLRLRADDSVGREAVRPLEALDCPLGEWAEQAINRAGVVAETPQAALKLSNGLGAAVGRVSRSWREDSGAGKLVGCRSRLRGDTRRSNEEQHSRGQQAGQPSPGAKGAFTEHSQN
jgi:hypothetical protein